MGPLTGRVVSRREGSESVATRPHLLVALLAFALGTSVAILQTMSKESFTTREGSASEKETRSLREYCESDVRSMFEIAHTCERLIYSREERQSPVYLQRRALGRHK